MIMPLMRGPPWSPTVHLLAPRKTSAQRGNPKVFETCSHDVNSAQRGNESEGF